MWAVGRNFLGEVKKVFIRGGHYFMAGYNKIFVGGGVIFWGGGIGGVQQNYLRGAHFWEG